MELEESQILSTLQMDIMVELLSSYTVSTMINDSVNKTIQAEAEQVKTNFGRLKTIYKRGKDNQQERADIQRNKGLFQGQKAT
ncbi:hypothetical protein Nmel_012277 [Mimus melanotis]